MIEPGNKVYCPEYCVFITQAINTLLTDHRAARGEYPQGVTYRKDNGKYRARINVDGKRVNLGQANTPEEASLIYRKAKYVDIIRHSKQQTNIRVKEGLIRHAELFLD